MCNLRFLPACWICCHWVIPAQLYCKFFSQYKIYQLRSYWREQRHCFCLCEPAYRKQGIWLSSAVAKAAFVCTLYFKWKNDHLETKAVDDRLRGSLSQQVAVDIRFVDFFSCTSLWTFNAWFETVACALTERLFGCHSQNWALGKKRSQLYGNFGSSQIKNVLYLFIPDVMSSVDQQPNGLSFHTPLGQHGLGNSDESWKASAVAPEPRVIIARAPQNDSPSPLCITTKLGC